MECFSGHWELFKSTTGWQLPLTGVSEQLPKTWCKTENTGVPLCAHTNTETSPALWNASQIPIWNSSFPKNYAFVTWKKGWPKNSLSTWENTPVGQLRGNTQGCSLVMRAHRRNPAKKINQWQSKLEVTKELQIWVSQGGDCADSSKTTWVWHGLPETHKGSGSKWAGCRKAWDFLGGLKIQTPSPP